ncbi:Signal peptidase I [Balamuthia mandrillaris]
MENTSKGFFGLSSAKDEDVSDEGTHWQTWKKVVRLPSLAKDASGELAWLRFSGGWSKFSDKSLALSADMKACRGPTLQFCYTQRDEPLTKSNTIPSDHNNDHSNCGLDSEAIRQVRLNSVLHNFHSGDHWQTVQQNASMNLKELSVVAYNDVWAVDFANKVWYWNGKLWEQEQDCLLSTISAGCDGTVWGVFNGTLLKRSTRKTSKSEESTWVEVRTRLFQPKQVAVGARHFVFVLDTDGKVWQWKDDVEQQDIGSSSLQAGSWERLICRPLDWLEKKNPLVEEHEEKWNILFSSLAAGAGETLWALDLSGCVWVQHGRSSSKLWERIEGNEPKGSVFSSGVDDGNEGEEEQEESNDKKRTSVPARLAMISVGDQANIYGLRYSSETNRSAVRWNGYRFEELGEEFGWISVSSNGEVWALSYDDNEDEGLEEAKEEKEEAEAEAPPSSTKYSKSQVYKCVRHGLDVVCCSTFEKLWDDGNTGSIRDVAFFRPIPPEGYYFLGDYAERTHLNLPKRACTLVVREQNLNDSGDDEENEGEPHKKVPLLAKPVTYERLWDTRDTGTTYGGRTGMTVWRPIPPEGYVALGDVVTPGQALEMPPPYLHYYRCVHLGLLQRGTFKKQSDIGWLWCDKNSGGSYGRCSVWTVDSRDIHSAAPPGTFIYLRDYYNSPPDSLAYCLAYATPL